jgi:undecaprenyl-diphosphatase
MDHFWVTVLLGIIEGITEFLPISSTGHLLIAEHWLGARSDAFNVVIQAGAVSAVVVIYWRKLLALIQTLGEATTQDYLLKLGIAFGITVVGGLVISHFKLKLPETLGPVAAAVLIGGLLIFAAEFLLRNQGGDSSITWHVAVAVGLGQLAAALFPGLSRSAATIIASMFVGLSRPAATEFSFLVGIPTMFAASAYALWKERHAMTGFDSGAYSDMALGFVISAVVAFLAVKWLIHYVQKNTFILFAWYRVVLGVGLLAWLVKK